MVQASNNFTITGRLTVKPEVKKTQNGKSYCYPSIAVQGAKKDDVQFLSFILWDKLAENIVKYCDKGDLISVLGSISFVKRDDGSKGYLQLTGDAVTFLSKAQKKAEEPAKEHTTAHDPSADPFVPAQPDVFAPFG